MGKFTYLGAILSENYGCDEEVSSKSSICENKKNFLCMALKHGHLKLIKKKNRGKAWTK